MPLLQFLQRHRAGVLRLTCIAYLAYAAGHASSDSSAVAWAGPVAAGSLALYSARRRGPVGWALFGLAVALSCLVSGGPRLPQFAWIEASGFIGCAIAAAATASAISSVPAAPGLLPSGSTTGRAMAVAAAAPWLLSAIAIVRDSHASRLFEYFTAPLSIALMVGHASTARARRALELDAQARLTASIGIFLVSAVALAVVIVVWVAETQHVGSLLATVGFVTAASAARDGDARRMAGLTRRVAVLAATGGAFILLLTQAARLAPTLAPAVVACAAVICLAIGGLGAPLEALLLGRSATLVRQLEKATRDVLADEPDEALRAALYALQPPDPESASPELYTLTPPRCTWVDAAGYAHQRRGELPSELLRHAASEPLGVLRVEVLEALEIRRPDLRSLLRWMHDCGALAATLIVRGGEVEGALLLPRANRSEPLTLEEAHALRSLCQGLAMAASAKAALERGLVRERAAATSEGMQTDRADALAHALAMQAQHHVRATHRLAQRAPVAQYSATSQLAYETLLRRVKAQAPVFLQCPSGVSPVPYLARAHLAGPRGNSPLVIVDGAGQADQEPAPWLDPRTSPLALADHGVLLLVDGGALPLAIQQLVAQTLAERRAPWSRADPLDVVLAFSSSCTPAELITGGRLHADLAARLDDAIAAPIGLPRLSERPEDLHALIHEGVSREGVRVRGAPVGIDAAASALLVEHTYPGEEAELRAIIQRLVASCEGEVVGVADVARLGLFRACDSLSSAEVGAAAAPRVAGARPDRDTG